MLIRNIKLPFFLFVLIFLFGCQSDDEIVEQPAELFKIDSKINLDQIQSFVDNKRVNPENGINLEILKKNNIINKSFLKYKILANGNLTSKINIEADFYSVAAKDKIEKLGGIIKIKNHK